MRRQLLFWMIAALLPVSAFLIGIGIVAYWTISPAPMDLRGGQVVTYDREIGFVPNPRAATERIDHLSGRDNAYHIFNDERGSRVSRAGDVSPARPDILFIGDSFTWGHGVENPFTFAALVPSALGVTGANVAMGSYGTTQAFQMLRRNLDRKPRLIVYAFISDHLRRNVLACAPSYFPFCFDMSHVVEERNGALRIAGPWSNGVRRARVQAAYYEQGLGPITWIVHGLDVAYGRVLNAVATDALPGPDPQARALDYLLGEIAAAAKSIDARLMFAFIPTGGPIPSVMTSSASKLGVPLLDLSDAYQTAEQAGGPSLTLVGDSHPSHAGHALIASEIVSFIRRHSLLD